MIGVKNDSKNENNNDIIKMFVISFLTSLFVVFCFAPYFARNAIIKTARHHNHRKQINVVNINGIPIYNPTNDHESEESTYRYKVLNSQLTRTKK